jgi:hypothetical protein
MPRISMQMTSVEYNRAMELLSALSSPTEQNGPTMNYTKMVDDDGRTWFGYNFDGNSWWITENMAAQGLGVDPYEIREVK